MGRIEDCNDQMIETMLPWTDFLVIWVIMPCELWQSLPDLAVAGDVMCVCVCVGK